MKHLLLSIVLMVFISCNQRGDYKVITVSSTPYKDVPAIIDSTFKDYDNDSIAFFESFDHNLDMFERMREKDPTYESEVFIYNKDNLLLDASMFGNGKMLIDSIKKSHWKIIWLEE